MSNSERRPYQDVALEFSETNIRQYMEDLHGLVVESSESVGMKKDDFDDLTIGNPYHPSILSKAEKKIVSAKVIDDEMDLFYSSATGFIKTRELISNYLNHFVGFKAPPENIVVTNGGSEAISIELQISGGSDREVVFISPGYPLHFTETLKTGGKNSYIETVPENDYLPTEQELVYEFTGKAGFHKRHHIVIAVPSNPTGGAFDKERQEWFAQQVDTAFKTIKEKTGKMPKLTLDLAYKGLDEGTYKTFFDGLSPEIAENITIIFSESKLPNEPGLRFGANLTKNATRAKTVASYKGPASNEVNAFSQGLGIVTMEKHLEYPEIGEIIKEEYALRRDILKDGMLEIHKALGNENAEKLFLKKSGGLFVYGPVPNVGLPIPDKIRPFLPDELKEADVAGDAKSAAQVLACASVLANKDLGIDVRSMKILPSYIFKGPDSSMARISVGRHPQTIVNAVTTMYYTALLQKAMSQGKSEVAVEDIEKIKDWRNKANEMFAERLDHYKHQSRNPLMDRTMQNYYKEMTRFLEEPVKAKSDIGVSYKDVKRKALIMEKINANAIY